MHPVSGGMGSGAYHSLNKVDCVSSPDFPVIPLSPLGQHMLIEVPVIFFD